MIKDKNISLNEVIEKGLKLMYERLLEKAIAENRELVVSDGKGNPVLVKATELKARLK